MDVMQEGVERFGHRIHAFCLMGNHVHLVIQVGDISLWHSKQKLVRADGADVAA